MKSDETKSTGRASDKFMLRLPDGMREKIAQAAIESKRSMNAEIIARLEDTFGGDWPSVKAGMLVTPNIEKAVVEFMQNYLDAKK